jgi:hypothetical protein
MHISEIAAKAYALGLSDAWLFSKEEMIRAIQRKEGNIPCFFTGRAQCEQTACLWRNDCLPHSGDK